MSKAAATRSFPCGHDKQYRDKEDEESDGFLVTNDLFHPNLLTGPGVALGESIRS